VRKDSKRKRKGYGKVRERTESGKRNKRKRKGYGKVRERTESGKR
jgi:hypothetical protein